MVYYLFMVVYACGWFDFGIFAELYALLSVILFDRCAFDIYI